MEKLLLKLFFVFEMRKAIFIKRNSDFINLK